ncbi:MAG: hypothetical protein J5654_06235 [Victivallales bacterium]|nr:hypothetical protein [Victivallales bacterium]
MPDLPLPLVIPYRLDESARRRGDELRLLLRSVARHVTGLSRVVLVCQDLPEWLEPSSVLWIRQGDPYLHCKDANLFRKVSAAVYALGLSGSDRWVFSADDCTFLSPCDLRTLPVIFNGHPREWFAAQAGKGKGKWFRRMVNTFDYLASRGVEMSYSYDCHLPQSFRADTIAEAMRSVDYTQDNGFCIYTLWRGLEGVTSGEVPQRDVCNHFETSEDGRTVPLDKPFCNYSDAPFLGGLRERLFAIFPEKSRFEK